MSKFTPSAHDVHDAQLRLARLGHDPAGDPPGTVGERTMVALQAFQRERGLPLTGVLDEPTRDRLHEAGWTLGERLLFLAVPPQRGDDVAGLQESLALLGFNPGRIDGIFGRLTQHSLEEFQHNCGLKASGVLTRATLDQLVRLSARNDGRRPVTEAHDTVRHLDDHRRRLVVVQGDGPLASELSEALGRKIDVMATSGVSDPESAAAANAANAALLLAVLEGSNVEGLELHYYESYRSYSTVGKLLASDIVNAFGRTEQRPLVSNGMALPILRETTMPALTIALGTAHAQEIPRLASCIAAIVLDLFDRAR